MNCPICGSNSHTEIYRLCDNLKILGKSFGDSPAYLVSCNECGLSFMNTESTQEAFLDYYKYGAVAPKYYDMFGQEDSDEYYSHIVGIVKKYVEKSSSILDVAGAWGEFANYLKRVGYDNVTNVDCNEKCAEASRQKGISTALCSSMNMAEIIEARVDMIILNHTLEHILDLDNTMRNVNELLKQNGFLFIEIPDAGQYKDEEAAPFNFLTYEHVLHMTENDIRNLANIYGYEVLEMEKFYKKVSNYPSIYAVLKKTEDKKGGIEYSECSLINIKKYVERSVKELSAFIKPLEDSREPLVLWGIGASTTILLEAFSKCNVVSLIDRNPSRQGLKFHIGDRELVVAPPEGSIEGTIVILSIPYAESIKRQILEMQMSNKIVTLSESKDK